MGFADVLKINFFKGKEIITKRKGNALSDKLEENGSIYLDLDKEKDRAILQLLMKSDTIILDGFRYKIIEREFVIDGTALFISVEELKD